MREIPGWIKAIGSVVMVIASIITILQLLYSFSSGIGAGQEQPATSLIFWVALIAAVLVLSWALWMVKAIYAQTTYPMTADGLKVHAVHYGADGDYEDVTSKARQYLARNRLDGMKVGNAVTGGYQPVTDVLKTMWVFYSRGVERRVYRAVASEQERLRLAEEEVWEASENRVEFFSSRQDLSRRRPLKEQIESATEVWGWWHTGGAEAVLVNVQRLSPLKRVILAHPQKSSLNLLCKATQEDPAKLRGEIRELTRKALESDLKLKWFPGLTACTMLIGDPNSSDSWIQVEPLIPCIQEVKGIPSFRIRKRDYPNLFNLLVAAYEDAWAMSIDPPKAKRKP